MSARTWVVVAAVCVAAGGLVSTGAAAGATAAPALHVHELAVADPQTSEGFGASVAVSGDTLVVGADGQADGDLGAAYVYRRSAAGWSHVRLIATLEPSDGVTNDEFGSGVAISGRTIVVSSPDDAIGLNNSQGAVYVFSEPRSGWSGTLQQSAKLTASDGATHDQLGLNGVAVSGSTVVAGSGNHEIGTNTEQGEAYVWTRPAGGWSGTRSESADLTSSDGEMYDEFGLGELGVSGDTIVAAGGAHDHERGALYVFVQPSSGWKGKLHESAELVPSDVQTGDSVGYESVNISGNTIVAGAPGHDADASTDTNQGAAYVFVRPKSGWSGMRHQNAELVASDGVANDDLGNDGVAISGRTVAVPAPNRAVDGVAGAGALYLFTEPARGWSGRLTQTSEISAPDPEPHDLLGTNSIALDGSTLLAGALEHKVGDEATQEGAAYVFAPGRPTLSGLKESQPSWRAGSRRAVVNPAHKPKKGGTRFSFALAQAGTVTMSLTRHRHGHSKPAGALTVAGRQGKNLLYFFGRLTAKKSLSPGKYSASFLTSNTAGVSTRHMLRFTVTAH